MEVTLITCTGDRHLCFALLERWISAQTYTGPMRWIVLDDGEVPVNATMGQEVVRMDPLPDQKGELHPMPRKLISAIDGDLLGDVNLIVEDDDYYAPEYVQQYADLLKENAVVGESRARYYHVAERFWWRHQNPNHASLAQTGFRGDMIRQLRESIVSDPDPFIDLRLWARARRAGVGTHLIDDERNDLALFVGMKAMPGRGGVACGHQKQAGYEKDRDWEVLKQWCPRDWRTYAELFRGV